MSDRHTDAIDPFAILCAQRQVAAGRAPSVEAFLAQKEAEDAARGERGLAMMREAAAKADPEKTARIQAHIDAQVAQLPAYMRAG